MKPAKIFYIAHYDACGEPLGKIEATSRPCAMVQIEGTELRIAEEIEALPNFSRWIPHMSFSEQIHSINEKETAADV